MFLQVLVELVNNWAISNSISQLGQYIQFRLIKKWLKEKEKDMERDMEMMIVVGTAVVVFVAASYFLQSF